MASITLIPCFRVTNTCIQVLNEGAKLTRNGLKHSLDLKKIQIPKVGGGQPPSNTYPDLALLAKMVAAIQETGSKGLHVLTALEGSLERERNGKDIQLHGTLNHASIVIQFPENSKINSFLSRCRVAFKRDALEDCQG